MNETSLLTLDEISSLLRVNRESIRKFMKAEDPLPFMKVGRRYLFNPEKVFRWAERQGKRSLSEKGVS